jgi:gamma-glutamylcyclotransferase (GGCT)/AIG2-like uncharacterized protein YtfP
MTRLFLYGTLLDPATLASCGGHAALPLRHAPATLHGWRRVAARGGRYPTLRRDRAGVVHGAVLAASARVFARLAAYEGPVYRLVRVVVWTGKAKTAAHAWVAPGATRRPWKE